MTTELAILNALLVFLTGLYVVITYKLVRETRRATFLNQEISHRHLQFSAFPQLYCGATRQGSRVDLTIYNSGSVPAIDVDITVLWPLFWGNQARSEFIKTHVQPQYQEEVISEGWDEQEEYGVYDHLVYYSFPQRRKVVVEFDQQVKFDQLVLLMQFRDVSGINYQRLYWFFDEGFKEERSRFKVGSIMPVGMVQMPRIEPSQTEYRLLESEDGSPLPSYIEKEFAPAYRMAISSGRLNKPRTWVEDPGQWYDL
jgi:hypothetical protein